MIADLIEVVKESDIPSEHAMTPIGQLIRYHNFSAPFEKHESAELLVGMCMDNRKQLRLPENFSYIIRTGGGNLRYSEFKLSYAIGVGGVMHVALIAHNHCGMVGLMAKKDEFIDGLSKLEGWDSERAQTHFFNYAPMFEIDNEVDFVVAEARRLREKYRGVCFVPLYYTIEDNSLSFISEEEE